MQSVRKLQDLNFKLLAIEHGRMVGMWIEVI